MGFQVDQPWDCARSKDGKLLINSLALEDYKISDIDDSSDPSYFGFLNKDGHWYIMEQNTANKTYRYASGADDYSTNWEGRAGLTYSYFNEAF